MKHESLKSERASVNNPMKPRDRHKSLHLGNTLSAYEANLYEYAAFSLTEEVDVAFCKMNNKEFAAIKFDDNTLRE